MGYGDTGARRSASPAASIRVLPAASPRTSRSPNNVEPKITPGETLAMPTFDSSLLALLGISAGTYLGLKIPEDTVPKK